MSRTVADDIAILSDADLRAQYIAALQHADAGDLLLLLLFVRGQLNPRRFLRLASGFRLSVVRLLQCPGRTRRRGLPQRAS